MFFFPSAIISLKIQLHLDIIPASEKNYIQNGTFPFSNQSNKQKRKRMPKLEKLVNTPQGRVNEHPLTMVLMVDGEMYQQYKKDSNSVALAHVVDSFSILKYENPGTEGLLNKPSRQELQDVFQTTDEYKIVEYMLENGSLSGHVRSS